MALIALAAIGLFAAGVITGVIAVVTVAIRREEKNLTLIGEAPAMVTQTVRPDVALAQHLLPGIAGSVGTCSGPFTSAEDSIKVTVYGRGSHGALPQNGIDPVVLAAMIIVWLQTVVSRVVTPGEIAIVTVASVQPGTSSNVIPDHAVLQLNVRSYSQPTRQRMLAAIQRIIRAECQASGSPKEPDFETLASFPLLDNDAAATDRVAAAFAGHFGDRALVLDRQAVSEDFGIIPAAAGVPYTYWGIGRTGRQVYLTAEKAGRLAGLPANHSPEFLPPLQPTLRTGTEALVTAAMAGSRRTDDLDHEQNARVRNGN
jgi:amidohydrolase